MTRSIGRPLVVFVAGVLAVVLGLGWVTFHALRLDCREQSAKTDAARQEAIRLALWRMDSLLTPIVAREAARPYFEYQAFYPADRAYTRMWQEVQPGEFLVPSPLLTTGERFVRLHFQINADGTITSPQVPGGNMRDQAEADYVLPEMVIEGEETLNRLGALVKGKNLAGAGYAPGEQKRAAANEQAGQQMQSDAESQVFAQAPTQVAQSIQEFSARQQAAETARNVQSDRAPERYARAPASKAATTEKDDAASKPDAKAAADEAEAGRKKEATGKVVDKDAGAVNAPGPAPLPAATPAAIAPPLPMPGASKGGWKGVERPSVEQGELSPVWVRGSAGGDAELLLVRGVRIGKSEIVQGVWLDWPAMRTWLVEQVADRVPGARLEPVMEDAPAVIEAGRAAEADDRLVRRLASIPAELVVAPAALVGPAQTMAWTPMRTALVLAWLAAIAAVGVIALVLRASVELAERRGRFVSAVTHELRTPLTTFCLYSQMLADGMVPQEAARKEYLGTLKREAQRLARIVENVLEYARLGRKRPANHRDHLTVQGLVERLTPPLRERAEQAGMQLVVEAEGLDGLAIDTDAQTVERIVFNLVDNACKYAVDAADGRVYVAVRGAGSGVEIEVADHGAGVKADDEAKVFDPFYRGSTSVDAASPGLGLGLALARGLARQLGGDLRLVRHRGPGARFVLALPA